MPMGKGYGGGNKKAQQSSTQTRGTSAQKKITGNTSGTKSSIAGQHKNPLSEQNRTSGYK